MSNEVMALPPSVVARGLDVAQWNTLCNSLFPGAKSDSVLMAVDYCKARQLDVMKKPCHIVPISVKQGESYVYRDVIMPGIYELRTTAMRTGLYLGHSPIEYGPEEAMFDDLRVPEWASMVVLRWNDRAARVTEFPISVLFREVVNLKNGKPNQRWAKAPVQMMDKCLEAAGLRKAFPDEIGGTQTDDEMYGRVIDAEPARAVQADSVGDDRADGDGGSEVVHRRSRGKPATQEPEATRSDASAAGGEGASDRLAGGGEAATEGPEADRITGAQKALIEQRLTRASLTKDAFCKQFGITAVELLPFDRAGEAKAWIDKNFGGTG